MFQAPITKLRQDVASAVSTLAANDKLRGLLRNLTVQSEPDPLTFELALIRDDAPDPVQWRIMDHCAAIVRLYALYERFVEELLTEWLSYRRLGVLFRDLPAEFQSKYNDGFAFVLGSLGRSQFDHLSAVSMISAFNDALAGHRNYRLFPECVTYHDHNLRLDELCQIFSRCMVDGMMAWISGHPILSSHFGSKQRIEESVRSKLKEFVEFRNEAAHGSVSINEILGLQYFIELSEFIVRLCEVMTQLIIKQAVVHAVDRGTAQHIGVVTKTYSDGVVVAMLEGATISVGDSLITETDKVCEWMPVLSLMVDDVPHERIDIANAKAIGIKFPGTVHLRARIFRCFDSFVPLSVAV